MGERFASGAEEGAEADAPGLQRRGVAHPAAPPFALQCEIFHQQPDSKHRHAGRVGVVPWSMSSNGAHRVGRLTV